MLKGIEVKGHVGTWYEVDKRSKMDATLYLMEHEEYGGDAPHIIINEAHELVAEDEWNWFEDYEYTLESEGKYWGAKVVDRELK